MGKRGRLGGQDREGEAALTAGPGGAGGSWAVTGVLAEERQPEGTGAEGPPDCVNAERGEVKALGGAPRKQDAGGLDWVGG